MVATAGASQLTALEPDRCQPGGGEEGMSDMSAEFFPNPEYDASGFSNGDTISWPARKRSGCMTKTGTLGIPQQRCQICP